MDMELKAEVFEFLMDLLNSGALNMFNAVPYLVQKFGFTNAVAREWLIYWMENYKDQG